MSEWVTGLAIVTVALVAGWFDVRERRIPNALTVSALGFALVSAALRGLPGLGASLVGAGICLLLALPFFFVRGLGGGDVKLLVVFGAFLGPTRILPALVVMAFVGGAWGLAVMIRERAVRRTFMNLYLMLQTVLGRIFARGKTAEPGFWVTLDTPGVITVYRPRFIWTVDWPQELGSRERGRGYVPGEWGEGSDRRSWRGGVAGAMECTAEDGCSAAAASRRRSGGSEPRSGS